MVKRVSILNIYLYIKKAKCVYSKYIYIKRQRSVSKSNTTYNYIIYQITSTYNTGKFQTTIFYIGTGDSYYFFVFFIEDLWLLRELCNKENNLLVQFANLHSR